jgi:hypothetical protein
VKYEISKGKIKNLPRSDEIGMEEEEENPD